MKNIVVPTDFSETASHALDFAIEFNNKFNQLAKITLIHVVEYPSYAYTGPGEIVVSTIATEVEAQKEIVKGVQKKLDQWAEKIKNANQEVETLIRHGNPYLNISKEIAKNKADWIIMGSKGASGLGEFFLGSNAERIVRHADSPVFVIKGPTPIDDMKSIVFASELTPPQDAIAQKALEIQKIFGLKLNVVKVRTPHNLLSKKAVAEQLEDFVKRNRFTENYSLADFEADYVDIGINKYAEDIGAGLIIMGTHGRTGLIHVFAGSMTEDLVNRCTLPVLSLKIGKVSIIHSDPLAVESEAE